MRDCPHLFAPCTDECTSYLYRATEITAKAKRELSRSNRWNFAGMVAVALMLELGLLIGGVSIWNAGAENWASTISQNKDA